MDVVRHDDPSTKVVPLAIEVPNGIDYDSGDGGHAKYATAVGPIKESLGFCVVPRGDGESIGEPERHEVLEARTIDVGKVATAVCAE
jgi:hypothetical protein